MTKENNSDSETAESLLLFHVSPVQDFISQARSTRDLWSGSYLISWLTTNALVSLTNHLRDETCIIFPDLQKQPLYHSIKEKKGDVPKLKPEALIPNCPNTFVAVVPAGFSPKEIKETVSRGFGESWKNIAGRCFADLNELCPMNEQQTKLWNSQISSFWQISCEFLPMHDIATTLDLVAKIPAQHQSALHLARKLAPKLEKRTDLAGLFEDINKPAWAWGAHFQLLKHRFEARRNTRNFAAWNNLEPGFDKDSLSGKEEAVADKVWLENSVQIPEVGFRFRKRDQLAAPNIIKRVWDRLVLSLFRAWPAFHG